MSEDAERNGAQDDDTTEPFDAIAAVAELEAAMQAADGGAPGGSDRYIAMLESEVTELNQLLEARDARLARAEVRLERSRDEIDTIKRRLDAESARELRRRTRDVVLTFIEVLDELDRALEAARGAGLSPVELVSGLEQVQRRFLATLLQHGVRPCPALGQAFDPALHEAITTLAVEAAREGQVVAVMRQGYTIGEGDLLRPAAVAVGRRS